MMACAGWLTTAGSAFTPSAGPRISSRMNSTPSWQGKRSNIMRNASPVSERPAAAPPELLGFLKGKDNPFDLFVAARKPDASFARYHVGTIHREVFRPLNAVLERYRLDRLERESDLPR